MGQALLFGLAASSALVIGGVAGAYRRPPKQVTGIFLAFASGALTSAALGVSLIEDASLTLLVAIFFSNLPESLVGAVAMRDEGRSRKCAIGIWCIAAVLLALAVVVGRVALEGVDGKTMAVAT